MVTAKEYLNRLITLDKEIKRKEARIKNLRSVAMSTAAKLKEDNVQQTRELNPLEKIMMAIMELEEEIDKDKKKLLTMKAEAWEFIDRLDDEREKSILWLKYCEGKVWRDVALDVQLSSRYVRKIHIQALEKLNEIQKRPCCST